MRFHLIAAAAALGALFGVAHAQTSAPAPAPSSSAVINRTAQDINAQLAQVGAWSGAFLQVVNAAMAPLQTIPHPPDETFNSAERHAWAESARTWAAGAQTSFATVADQARALPPPPNVAMLSEEMRTAMAAAPQSIIDMMTGASQLADQYRQLADAFERRQSRAIVSIRVSVIDSVALTFTLIRQVNLASAAAVGSTHPQNALLLSFVSSYDGMASLLRLKRAALAGEALDRGGAAAGIEAAAQDMRMRSASGRAAARVMLAELPETPPNAPDAIALLDRARALFQSYDASFDRELAIANELDAIAVLLRDSRSLIAVEPEIDRHSEIIGNLDAERLVDAQHRQELLSR